MTFTKILCPIDFSEGAEQALRAATHLSTQTGVELVIAHSWYEPPSAYSVELAFPLEVAEQVLEDAQQQLDAIVAECKAAGAKHVSSLLLSGIPWREVVDLLERQPFDLCVIGTQGRTGMRRFLLGSVAEKVVRHAPCSVLVIHPNDAPKSISHVVVPTDFSDSARFAGNLAAGLIPGGGALTLFHVIEVPISYAGQHPVRAVEVELCQRASADLENHAQALQRTTTARVRTDWRIGHPGREILDLLERDASVDLVAIGTHGRTGIKRALLGSVAEKVLRHAARPVLVARKRTMYTSGT